MVKTRLTIALAVSLAAVGLTVPAASASAMSTATPTSEAACDVETIRWYEVGGYKHVILRNFCGHSKKVCVQLNGIYIAGPKSVPAYQQSDWTYAPPSGYKGNSVYYCG